MHLHKATRFILSGDFKPEDLARAWVHMFTKNLTEDIPFIAREAGLKQVYFMGNFFNHKLIRDDVTEAMLSNFIGKVKVGLFQYFRVNVLH